MLERERECGELPSPFVRFDRKVEPGLIVFRYKRYTSGPNKKPLLSPATAFCFRNPSDHGHLPRGAVRARQVCAGGGVADYLFMLHIQLICGRSAWRSIPGAGDRRVVGGLHRRNIVGGGTDAFQEIPPVGRVDS